MVNGNVDQIERLIQAVNDIADLIPTSAESSADLSGQPGAVGGLPLDQLVDANIGHILGANPSKDPQRIVNLLTGAFAKQVGGATGDYQWRQRGSVPAEASNGVQVAGQQAAVYQELKDREEAANRLLDAVVPVILGPDEDEINEVKDRIRTTVSGIVAESGRPGGAVLDRIDVLFETLESDLQELKGKLGLDQNKLPAEGFKKELDVATAEQIQANFESLEKIYIGKAPLADVRDRLAEANDSSGTRLSRLLRAIEAIPNTVQQALTVMNSVRFGAAERRVTGVESDNDTTTFEQLFDWIEQSALADWPNTLIGGGAKRSDVVALRLAAQKQRDKLNQLTRNENARLKQVMDVGVNRVSTVVAELRRELKVVKALTPEIANVLTVQAVTPATGDPAGGEPVAITGLNLQKVVSVFFGSAEGKITPPINEDGASINVKTPAQDPNDSAVVDVTVKQEDGTSDTLADSFRYVQPAAPAIPTFELLSPTSGPANVGQPVGIVGSNLSTVSKVTFGGVPATIDGIDQDGTFIKVTAPPHTSGPVNVVVTADNKDYTLPVVFNYIEPTAATPEPKMLTPTSGPDTGGTSVMIVGSNLSKVNKVTFGGIPIAIDGMDQDGTFIQVTAPSHDSGPVNVVVTADNKDYTVPPGFNYTLTAPTFNFLSPLSGPTGGGTNVTIVGSNLSKVTKIKFRATDITDTDITDFQVDADGVLIEFKTPIGVSGRQVHVVVTDENETEYTLPWIFTYEFPGE